MWPSAPDIFVAVCRKFQAFKRQTRGSPEYLQQIVAN